MSDRIPRLLLCAPSSGSGKTTVTCAFLQALVNRGANPAAFKCGPDYIDPMFHSKVIGAKSRNLDLFFLGGDKTRRLLVEHGKNDGISIIEGVMGYYDGIGMTETAGAYDLARETKTPSVLVVNGRGSATSLAALVKGFVHFRIDSGIKGVILNRISEGMYRPLKECIERETGVAVYGYMPEMPDCTFESRHLGLITAEEIEDLRDKLHRLAGQAEETLDIDGLIALSQSAPVLKTKPISIPDRAKNAPVIAVAKDKAFCFYYEDSLALLRGLGAKVVEFSPLEDKRLPWNCSGLYLGGGYPELYARELSENYNMLAAIKAAIDGGMPTIAECGGFLYLHDTLEGADSTIYHMAGVVTANAYRTPKLPRFGYATLTAKRDGLLGPEGTKIPAHEFHYWDSTNPGDGFRAEKPLSNRSWDCGIVTATLYAGFPHFHLLSAPESAARFVRECKAYSANRRRIV